MKKFLISILCCLCTLFLSLTLTSCDTTRDVAPEKIMTYVNKMQPIEEIKPLAIDVTYYELQEKVASEKIIISETEIYMFRDIETEDAVQIVDEYWFTIEKSEKDGVADKYIAYQKNKDENDGNLTSKTITKEEYDSFMTEIYKNFYKSIMISDVSQIIEPGNTKFVSGISNIYFTYTIDNTTSESVNYKRNVSMVLSKHDGSLSVSYRLSKYSVKTYDPNNNDIATKDVVFSEKSKDTTIPSR